MSTWRTKSPAIAKCRCERCLESSLFDRSAKFAAANFAWSLRAKRSNLLSNVIFQAGGDFYVGFVNSSVKVPKGERGLIFMRDFIKKNGRPKLHGDPPFTEGFVGFLSYDFGVRMRQSICPETHFVYVDKVFPWRGRCEQSLRSSLFDRSAKFAAANFAWSLRAKRSNLTREQYFNKIAAIKKYLFAGDTYQVNFSQKFEIPYDGEAAPLFEKLAGLNPSPHQFFFETDDFAVISNSPERLFQLSASGEISTRPIKGTVPRTSSESENQKNLEYLLSSEKEKAELAMIVDLERNDLGKICAPGSVEVTEKRTVEAYSHVFHTAANIRGRLSPGYDWYDALHALFPGGSVTGCPKKRTMEIIAELEGEPRGVYCGSAGYIDLSGACDFNILIRTLWYDKKSNRIIFRSGGGIVVDSNPEKEYCETLHKSKALIAAIHKPSMPEVP